MKKLDDKKVLERVKTMLKNKKRYKELRRELKPASLDDIAKEFEVTRQAILRVIRRNE